MNNPNTLNPPVLTETLSVLLPLDFIKALIADSARARPSGSHSNNTERSGTMEHTTRTEPLASTISHRLTTNAARRQTTPRVALAIY